MKRHIIPAAGCLWFFVVAQFFVPSLGIQNDEARFTAPIYLPSATFYSYRLGPLHLPVMLASYAGTLKTLLWWPFFAIFGTSVWTLREPAILGGVATIWFFHALLRRVAGERAAAVGCVLLAVDPMFLLTSCYDWGPQVLQHLLLTAGVLAAVASSWTVAAFLFGLALWEKALALWLLGGMGIATVILYPRAIPLRRLGVIAMWFALGMSPLILYNIHSRLGTLRDNAQPDRAPIAAKIQVMRATFDGSGLFGFLDAGPLNAHHHWMLVAFLMALLLAPLAGPASRRIILFCALTMLIAWAQMLWTAGSGGSVHHTILLWPLPHAIMGISFAAASRRLGRRSLPALAGLTAVLAISCSLVTLDYHRAFARYGARPNWSPAISALADYLKTHSAPAIYPMDWGFSYNVAFLTAGRLPLNEEITTAGEMLGHPDALYIAHAPGAEVFPEQNARFLEAAAKLGYRQQQVTQVMIRDNFGRPLFVVYQMTK